MNTPLLLASLLVIVLFNTVYSGEVDDYSSILAFNRSICLTCSDECSGDYGERSAGRYQCSRVEYENGRCLGCRLTECAEDLVQDEYKRNIEGNYGEDYSVCLCCSSTRYCVPTEYGNVDYGAFMEDNFEEFQCRRSEFDCLRCERILCMNQTEPQPQQVPEPQPEGGCPTMTEPEPEPEPQPAPEPQCSCPPITTEPEPEPVPEPQSGCAPIITEPEPTPEPTPLDCSQLTYLTIAGISYKMTTSLYDYEDATRLCSQCLNSQLADIMNAGVRQVASSNLNNFGSGDEYWIGRYDGGEFVEFLVFTTGPSASINVEPVDKLRGVICDLTQ